MRVARRADCDFIPNMRVHQFTMNSFCGMSVKKIPMNPLYREVPERQMMDAAKFRIERTKSHPIFGGCFTFVN
jgi:hypothetical protein